MLYVSFQLASYQRLVVLLRIGWFIENHHSRSTFCGIDATPTAYERAKSP